MDVGWKLRKGCEMASLKPVMINVLFKVMDFLTGNNTFESTNGCSNSWKLRKGFVPC